MDMYSKFAKTILLSLLEDNESSIVQVARKHKIFSYSELVRARRMLEEKGFIISEKRGRNRLMKLTEKGIEMAKTLKRADELIL